MSSYPDRSPGLLAYNGVMIGVTVVATAIRIWSRVVTLDKKNGKLWWDDYVLLAALPVVLATNALFIHMVHLGIGKSAVAGQVPPENVAQISKLLFVLYIVYDTGLTLTKCAALFFYARVFEKCATWFVWALRITQFMVWAWWIAIILASVFLCDPVAKQWIPDLPGRCNPTGALWVGSAVPSVVIDFIILLIPVPILWKLQMTLTRRLLLIGIFLCGYSVVIMSLGRLITVTSDEEALNRDITYESVDSFYWLMGEAPITIMSLCLPNIFILYHRAPLEDFQSGRTAATDKTYQKSLTNPSAKTSDDRLYSGEGALVDPELGQFRSTVESNPAGPMPPALRDNILVSNELEVTSQEKSSGSVA